MRIAILGATSSIAQDLIRHWSFSKKNYELFLYARDLTKLKNLTYESDGKSHICPLDIFPEVIKYDVILNFIGAGDPKKIADISSSILTVTNHYDDIVLNYLSKNEKCKYIYMSSGAVYGDNFMSPASAEKGSNFHLNQLRQSDFYGLSKFIAEAKHRERAHNSIVDVRIFNYFSRKQDISSRYLITDLIRAVKNDVVCEVNPQPMIRDYLNPLDFAGIIDCIISYKNMNGAVDCYSNAPISKDEILSMFESKFGLKWKYTHSGDYVNATNTKEFYYSTYKILEAMGYSPKYTSSQTILDEVTVII
ncbi:NAD-dependent epimerase/dehydratase family protein [Shewanella sp.]|uniref:NAD-dependent epimerase/dehydratase family protein n=1 Tax=Shewanella sp. TaxID=50422 RepID=UPI003A978DEB